MVEHRLGFEETVGIPFIAFVACANLLDKDLELDLKSLCSGFDDLVNADTELLSGFGWVGIRYEAQCITALPE